MDILSAFEELCSVDFAFLPMHSILSCQSACEGTVPHLGSSGEVGDPGEAHFPFSLSPGYAELLGVQPACIRNWKDQHHQAITLRATKQSASFPYHLPRTQQWNRARTADYRAHWVGSQAAWS